MVLTLTVLMGFAALTIDFGQVAIAKSKAQNAADAAVMAAVMELPNQTSAVAMAKAYAAANGFPDADVTVVTPYDGDAKKIKVTCNTEVEYTFAKVLGFESIALAAEAVAQKAPWAGDAMPFINLDDDYTEDAEIVAWEKVDPGDFESINNFEIINPDDPATLYFKVDYLNGVELKKGTVATIKQEVGFVYDRGNPVYILSLSSDVIKSGKVLLMDGTLTMLTDLKNKDIVDPSQLVLLKCDFHDYDNTGKSLYLTVLDEYDIANGEFPPDYEPPDGGSSMLVG